MTSRFYEIIELAHRILNPTTDGRLMLVGEICRLDSDHQILDLACGKGEMLCRWAQEFGVSGVGVDLSKDFLTAARARAEELGVAGRVDFVRLDASAYVPDRTFDVVSCLGASWIGDDLAGTLAIMRSAVPEHGLLLVGEPYWISEPPPGADDALGFGPGGVCSLPEMCDRFTKAGTELVEMVLSDQDCWDRYVAPQWWTTTEWLRANPDDQEAAEVREFLGQLRRNYLEFSRRYLGWGVFVLRPTPT